MTHPSHSGTALIVLLCALGLPTSLTAQSSARPDSYAIQGVRLERTDDGRRATLVLRDGRVVNVLEPDAALPHGVRVIDGAEFLALPAFVDAFSRAGCATPTPGKDQDEPVDVTEDIRVDMRQANRKGIQPAFRAIDVFSLDESSVKAWAAQGFGSLLSAPGGQLLAGSSALAAVREAPTRDLVLEPVVHAHAAFRADGSGYPSTLMGYHSQLRQFFMDSRHHGVRTQRFEQGRPGPRPAFDEDLERGMDLMSSGELLVCEAQTARDVERWMGLAEEFGLNIAISGGRDAWKVADRLAMLDIPVILTLDWGDEVDDPVDGNGEDGEDEADDDADRWSYEEPLGVREERRRSWEERRDCAQRLHEAGVRFAFGTGDDKPKALLENVRKAVAGGLSAEVALTALTSGAARLLGAEDRLGGMAAGRDATLTLWSGDPLTDDKAEPAWVFVDGFPYERELKSKKRDGAAEGDADGPGEGVNVTGAWVVKLDGEEGEADAATLTLEMTESGDVTGTFEVSLGGEEFEGDVDGVVRGHALTLSGEFQFGGQAVSFEIEGTVDGDDMEGEEELSLPWAEEPEVIHFSATRTPGTRGGAR